MLLQRGWQTHTCSAGRGGHPRPQRIPTRALTLCTTVGKQAARCTTPQVKVSACQKVSAQAWARMRLRSSLGCPPAGPGSSQLILGAGSGLVHRVGELGEVCWGRTKHPTVQCKVEAGQGLGPSSSGSIHARGCTGCQHCSAPPPAAETETPDPTERPPDDIHGIPGQLGPKPSDRQPSSSRLFFHSPPGAPASAACPKGTPGCTTSGHHQLGAGTRSNSGCFSQPHSAVPGCTALLPTLGTLRA